MYESKSKIPNFVKYYLLIIASIIMSIYIVKQLNINFFINFKTFDILHTLLESLISLIGTSIFLLIVYSYPYERDMKYILSGSLYLDVAMLSIYHTFTSAGHVPSSSSTIASALAHLLICSAILISISYKKNYRVKSKLQLLSIPLFSIGLCFILLLIFSRFGESRTCIEILSFLDKSIYHMLLFMYLVTNSIAIAKYNKSKNFNTINTLNALTFLIISSVFLILHRSNNDFYVIAAHMCRLVGLLFVFKIYFVNNIKKPYIEMSKAKSDAIEASRIKTDFLVNLSHELRTPVNVILCALNLLETSHLDEYPFDSIKKNTLRINKLCENILAFNNIENGNIDFTYTNEDIVFIIDDILEEADNVADRKNLNIEFIHSGYDNAVTDVDKFAIILLNLISNSLKYCKNGGDVTINLNIEKTIDVEIYNNGPKILPNEVEKIFDKFYKSKDDRLESTEGLGIGLYISRKYTEVLGGKIKIINAENKTGFKISIPIAAINSARISEKTYTIRGFFSDICE